jgi:hypothetical protein
MFVNRSKLPSEAFTCPTCSEVAGTCEHTDPKIDPRYEVMVCGIIKGRREPMNEVLIMGPVTPMPMKKLPIKGGIFDL